ncbi:MAG: hypothetical protein DMD35_08100 [Gemmatimonadetes bacterium]|nr:MAG: hypothetical protein DMD35_08100 [Gemmatimonadota bacterium]
MSSAPEWSNPLDADRVVAACSRLDQSISGYNRHAVMSERYRRSMERFNQAQSRFESVRWMVEETRATVGAQQAARAETLERMRVARVAMAEHRASIESCVRDYVHALRDEGLTPEKVLVAVKGRLTHAVTEEAPDAPVFEAQRLAVDVLTWTIDAYYDAA